VRCAKTPNLSSAAHRANELSGRRSPRGHCGRTGGTRPSGSFHSPAAEPRERQPVQAGDLQRSQRCRETLAEAGNQPCSTRPRALAGAERLPVSRVEGTSGLPSSDAFAGVRGKRPYRLSALRRGGLASWPSKRGTEEASRHAFTRGCSARSPVDTDFPGSAGTSERQEVLGSCSGWGKSVLAPRTLTRGSRGHLV
jgi:hypothetical protein